VYEVRIKRKLIRSLEKLPERMQVRFQMLYYELVEFGPVRNNWPNYSALGNERFHCHLHKKWVVVWYWEKPTNTIQIEYAGSREDAPY